MMTWMTRASLFDSALDMELPELAMAQIHSQSLLNELLFGEPDVDMKAAPLPLSRMWQGYEVALAGYSVACAAVMVSFGVTTGLRPQVMAQGVAQLRAGSEGDEPLVLPPWIQDIDVLRSHRSNMMRRWPGRYDWPRTPVNMPYIWPIVDDAGGYILKLSKYDRGLLASGERKLPTNILERIQE